MIACADQHALSLQRDAQVNMDLWYKGSISWQPGQSKGFAECCPGVWIALQRKQRIAHAEVGTRILWQDSNSPREALHCLFV